MFDEDVKNYDYLSIQMKTLFMSQDMREMVKIRYKEPQSNKILATWSKEKKNNRRRTRKEMQKSSSSFNKEYVNYFFKNYEL